MFDGWLRFGGVEVANTARVEAYAKAGCAPPGVEVNAPTPCDLAAALGHGEYRQPAADPAPWFNVGDPDTYWFGGVIPLEVTGLDGTTRTAGVVERTGDGAAAGRARRGSRIIAVSALLVGRDAATVHAGLEWLTTVLHRTCDDTPGCAGSTLEVFTGCPSVDEGEDMTAPLEGHPQDPSGEWLTAGGVWTAALSEFRVREPVVPGGVIDGGVSDSTYDADADGGGAGTAFDETVDGGVGRTFVTAGLLATPTVLGCLSEVVVEWVVTPLADSATVEVGAVDRFGATLDRGDRQTVYASTTVTRRWVLPSWEEWRPALWSDAPGVTVEATVSHRPFLGIEECVAGYRRRFQNVTCLAGPTVVGTFDTSDCDDDRLVQVEWTWAAGDPYRYGEPAVLMDGMGGQQNTPALLVAEGATAEWVGVIGATACPLPATGPPTCATDPNYPSFTAPPAAPVIADPGIPAPPQWYRSILTVNPFLTPNVGAGALTFTFNGDTAPIRNVRVRMWAGDNITYATRTECDFEQEFTLRYLPADSAVIVDATSGSVTVVCDEGATLVDGRRLVRGAYGGAFEFPTIHCDRRYIIAVDFPKYALSETGTSDAASWSVDVSPREG